MRAYGLRRPDRVRCMARIGKKRKRTCQCGDMSSKHPKNLQKTYNISKQIKHHARQQNKKHCLEVA